MADTGAPAIQQWVESNYGGTFQTRESTVAVGAGVTQLVDHDFERVGMVFVNTGAVAATIAPNKAAIITNGILLVAAGGSLTVNVRDDLVLPGFEWSAISSGAGTTIYVLQVVRFKGIEK